MYIVVTLLLGAGWRIPTNAEWTNVDANGGWNSYTNAYASVLKIHAAGYLDGGALRYRNEGGNYNGLYSGSTQNSGTVVERYALSMYTGGTTCYIDTHRKSVAM